MNKGTKTTLTALFAAVISAAAFIHIPLPGGLPIVLQDALVILSGLLLGPVYGGISVLIFLVLGALGLPVFSGSGGLHILVAGPTCGFLFGYLVSAIVAGLVEGIFIPRRKRHSKAKTFVFIAIAAILANVVLFTMGIAGFMHITGKPLNVAVGACLLPFIPGNTIKLIVDILLAGKFRQTVSAYMGFQVEDK